MLRLSTGQTVTPHPEQPVRQWVLSFPYPLRFLFASRPVIMSKVLGIVYRVIATHLIKKAGFSCKTAHTGAVTFIQRAGSALNLNQAERNLAASRRSQRVLAW